jgi:1-aminocyclopropane-1-carboxylate deaminase/D-cysteine desulfhydrase-like pyridoxal-dependent ACC family enzyme
VKAFLKAMDNTNGKMEIFIVETLRKDLNMAKENGNKNHKILMNLINSTNSKVITFTI